MRVSRLGFLGIVLLAISCRAHSQSSTSCNIDDPPLHIGTTGSATSSHACALLRQAFSLLEAHKLAAAEQRFRNTIESAKPDTWALEAYAHYGLGMCLSADSHFDSAKPELRAARSAFDLNADSLGLGVADHELGRISYLTSQRQQAIALYDQAIAEFQSAGDQHRELTVRLNKEDILPTSPEKVIHLRELEATSTRLHDDLALGMCLHSEGDALFTSGDYASGLSKYREALTLMERTHDKAQMAAVLISMGRLERAHGRAQAAFPYYRRALRIERELGRREGEILVLNAMATAYDSLERHTEGMSLLRQALALARVEHSTRYERFELGNLASDYMEIGRCDRAIPLLQQVIAGEDSDYVLGYRYQALEHCLWKTHKLPAALEAANRAVDLRQHDKNEEALLDTLLVRAQIRSQLGDAPGAIDDTDQVLAKLEGIRDHIAPNDYLKRGFLDSSKEYYDTAILVRARQGDFARAAEIAEQGRARAFLDLMATRESAEGAKQQSSQLAPAATADPRSIASDSTVSAQSFNAEQMIDAARRLNSTILTYWSAEEDLLIFVISPNGKLSGHRVSVGSDRLRKLLIQTRPGAVKLSPTTDSDSHTIPDVWRELYSLLIAPVEADLPRASGALLTIVPHGALFEVPFEALRDGHSRYLVERYAIHYLPAVAVLEYTGRNREQALNHPRKNLLVAQTFAEANGRLQRLPAAAAEIKKISLAVGSSVSLRDSQLRAQELEQEMSDATLVHLATHAVFDNASPMSSYLLVAPERAEDEAGNRITASQIYDLHVPADLVVLSACQTGRGKVTGDGVLGMTRAFFAAGAATVIASVWDVPDAPTEQLMVSFYRGLQRGLSKSEAMRQAQLALIHRLREKKMTMATAAGSFTLPENPQFWAGFVLEGNP